MFCEVKKKKVQDQINKAHERNIVPDVEVMSHVHWEGDVCAATPEMREGAGVQSPEVIWAQRGGATFTLHTVA